MYQGTHSTCTAWLQAYFMQPARCSWLLTKSQLAHSASGQPSRGLNHRLAMACRASGAPEGTPPCSSGRNAQETSASVA